MEVDRIIAANLKRLREERNLSLSQLAARSGLSKVTLSQLERGGANPTINNIWKIANALGVPYTSLLDSSSQGAAVIRREELSAQESEDGQCRVLCYYASSAERNFEWFRLELNAGGSYTSRWPPRPRAGVCDCAVGHAAAGDAGAGIHAPGRRCGQLQGLGSAHVQQ